jgi:hypothetical protein
VRLLPIRPDHGGLGYCWHTPKPNDADIDAAMSGNIFAAAPIPGSVTLSRPRQGSGRAYVLIDDSDLSSRRADVS